MSLYNGVLYVAPPPQDVVPNISAPYEASELLGVIGVFLPVTTVIMGVRVYSRVVLSGNFAFDDCLMVMAFVLGVIMISFILDMLNWGLGKHIWDVPLQPDFMPNWSFDNLLAAIFFCAATGFAKGSILLFYLRIFPTRRMQWAVWLSFAFVMGFSLASVLVNIFSCSPVRGSWDLVATATAVCINRPVFYFAQAGLGIFADVLTLVLPLPMLRTLQLPFKQKVGIAVVLTMGGFVCVVSIIRLQTLGVLMTDADLTKNTTTALAWCVIELLLSIIGGSIPALKPFIRRFVPRLLGSTHGRRGARERASRAYIGGGGELHQYYYQNSQGQSKAASSKRRSVFKFPTSAPPSPQVPEFILETVSVKVTTCGKECLCGMCPRTPGCEYLPPVEFSLPRKRSDASSGQESREMILDRRAAGTGEAETGGGVDGGSSSRLGTPLPGQQHRKLGHNYSIEGPRRVPSPILVLPVVSTFDVDNEKSRSKLR